MINILLSVLVFAVVKVNFLWMFAPKKQQSRRVPDPLLDSEDDLSLFGRQDRTPITRSLIVKDDPYVRAA